MRASSAWTNQGCASRCTAFPIRISGTKAAITTTARLRARMRAIVDAAQPAGVHVAVDLSCRERAVAEELLDYAQVGAALEQVSGEGVSETVRVRDEPAERAGVEPPAARREKERVLGAHRQLRASLAEIRGQAIGSFLAEWHRALLAALAPNGDGLLLEVAVLEVEADRLGAAQAGRIDQLDERAVAEPEGAVSAQPLEQRVHLACLGRRRQAACALRRQRGVGDARRSQRVREQRPDRGELASDARRGELRAPTSELGCVLGQHAHF